MLLKCMETQIKCIWVLQFQKLLGLLCTPG